MTVTASDLGVLSDLATALGIMRDGSPDPGWLGDPAARLGSVLADDAQRQALVSFLDEVLDDGSVAADEQGRVRLPLVTHDDPDLTVAVVLEPKESTVVIGLGVELRTVATSGPDARPGTESQLDVALLQVARGTAPPPDPVLLLGHRGGRIRLSSTLHLDDAAGTGDVHLGSIAVSVDVPTTDDDDDPAIGLRLGGLQLPGGTARDLDLSLSRLDELDDIALDLVLGLVRAQAASATGPFAALASLLGLGRHRRDPAAARRAAGDDRRPRHHGLARRRARRRGEPDRVVRGAGRPDPGLGRRHDRRCRRGGRGRCPTSGSRSGRSRGRRAACA